MEETMALSVVDEFTVENITKCIISLPGKPYVMLANQLAEIYGTTTYSINRAVKRNPERFPAHFYFQASDSETSILKNNTYYALSSFHNTYKADLAKNVLSAIHQPGGCSNETMDNTNNDVIDMYMSNMDNDVYDESNVYLVSPQTVTGSNATLGNNNIISKNISRNPYIFTMEGADMLSAVLHSKIAIRQSIRIMEAYAHLQRSFYELCSKPPQFFLTKHDLDLSLYQEVSAMQKCFQTFYKKMEELKDQTGTRRLFDRPAFEYKDNCSDAKSYYRIEDIDWLVSYFDLTKKGLYQVLEDQLLKASKRTKFPPRFFDKNNPNSIFFRIDAVYDLQLKLKNNPKLLKKFRINLFDTV